MFFGLCNSPATFQRMINDILWDLIDGGHVVVYLDDILIFTSDLREHRKLVHQVLQRLREHHLYLKESKCFFEEEEIAYLGLIVGKGMVKTDPKKIQAVKDWSPLTIKREYSLLSVMCCMTVGLWPSGIFSFYDSVHLLFIL